MAATFSISLSLDLHNHHHHHISLRNNHLSPFAPSFPHLKASSFHSSHFKSSFSHSSPPPPPLTTDSTAATTTTTDATSRSPPFIDDPFKTQRFLTDEEFNKLKFLEGYVYYQELESGYLGVRVMRADEIDETVELLAESFAVSMLLPSAYVSVLGFLVKQYLIERRSAMPHAATLIGFYRGKDAEEEGELAGTVEVCFDKRGANASPPTPTPPKNAPYICNMTVRENLRRRGIGWHLLKAGEELISHMGSSKQVYLHCRMIDQGPFNMYRKAGYDVVKTDGIFVLLMFQRRKHLMCKELPPVESAFEIEESTFGKEEHKQEEEKLEMSNNYDSSS